MRRRLLENVGLRITYQVAVLSIPEATFLVDRVTTSATLARAGLLPTRGSFDFMLSASMMGSMPQGYNLNASSIASEGAAVGGVDELNAAIA